MKEKITRVATMKEPHESCEVRDRIFTYFSSGSMERVDCATSCCAANARRHMQPSVVQRSITSRCGLRLGARYGLISFSEIQTAYLTDKF